MVVLAAFLYFMQLKRVYDQPFHSNKKYFTSASSVSSGSSMSSPEAFASFEKSRKHNGGNSTHHKFAPSPSPSVINTATYSPPTYTNSPYYLIAKSTLFQ